MEKHQDIPDGRLAQSEITTSEHNNPHSQVGPTPKPLTFLTAIISYLAYGLCALSLVSVIHLFIVALEGTHQSNIRVLNILAQTELTATNALLALGSAAFAVLFLYWVYRAARNLELKNIPLRITPVGAVVWWFVPIAFFWQPYRIVSQLWRASVHGADWAKARAPKSLPVWWALFWVGLLLSIVIGFTAENGDKTFMPPDVGLAFSIVNAIVEAIIAGAILLIARLARQISAAQEMLPAFAAPPTATAPNATQAQIGGTRPPSSWFGTYTGTQAAGIAALVLLAIAGKHLLKDNPGSASNWRVSAGADAISGAKAIYAHGHPTDLTGTNIPPTLIIECTGGKPLIAFDYKQPMKDAAPDGSLDFVHVTLKVDNDQPVQLSFVPSQDWTVLSQSKGGAVADGTAAILSGIFGDFLPEAKNVRLSWDAQIVLRAIGQSNRLVTRATARNNMAVTATYDLAGFKEAYRAMPASCQ